MKAISANLLRANWPTPALRAIAGMALLTSSLLLLWAREQQELVRTARAAMEKATASQSEASPLLFRHQSTPSYERSARELLKERSLSWSQGLAALEATRLDGVIPRAFDASAATGAMRIEVVAVSHEKLLAYVDALNAGVGMDGGSLYWGLQQSQVEPATKFMIATITGRVPGSGAK